MSQNEKDKKAPEKSPLEIAPSERQFGKDMIIAFAIPTVIGKTLIVYFGGMYSQAPGEGWGYALSAAIFFTCFNFARFIWKYRDYSD